MKIGEGGGVWREIVEGIVCAIALSLLTWTRAPLALPEDYEFR